IATDEDAGTPLAAWIPAAAYSAYQGAADDPVQFPSMQLVVDFNGAAEGGFSTLTYEPVYNPGGGTAPDEWHRYEAGAGNWCSTREIPGVITDAQRSCSNGGAKPLTEYVAGQPEIVVNALVLNQGTGNPGLDAAVDLVSTPSTTYDFELTAPEVVPGPDECEETTLPELPELPEGEHGGGHEDGGQDDGGHEDGGNHDGGNAGHEQPDAGHEGGGHEGGGHEGGENGGGGGEEPEPQPEPCS
ncbi:MAG TPA: hypothetical protein VK935_06395, partial [Actinomycetospora sp.]|nr:hypothetical protein [Actinomycetospora sp.]